MRLALILLLVPANAAGQEIFELDARVDVPIIATSLAIAGFAELAALPQLPAPACLPDCHPDDVIAIDRPAIGWHSRAAELASDSLVLGLPAAGAAFDYAQEQGRGFWQDATVVLEAYAVTGLIVTLAKFAVRRPRPYVYDQHRSLRARSKPSAALSFFSGHASLAFATAVAYSEVFRRRNEGVRVPIFYASALGLAAAVGLFRMLAGKHFLTDVLAGAIVGSSIGWLIPTLHDL